MRILQVTDLHFKATKPNDDQAHVCQAIAAGLSKEEIPDLIFFTGDLVYTGNNQEVFDQAWAAICEPLTKHWGIGADRFFICPGNHDMNRDQELGMITTGVNEIDNLHSLDTFAHDPKRRDEFLLSLKNNDNYFDFLGRIKEKHFASDDVINPLFTAHRRTIKDRSVGIVALNSAWRCKSSKTDRNNLLFPPSLVHEAFEHVKDCQVRLLLMHHPISDFKEFVSREMERLIYRDFHVLFTGHIHGQRLDTHLLSEEGIAIVVGPAALVHYESWSKLGCGFYDIDCDLWSLKASVCEYDKQSSTLSASRHYGTIKIPFNSEKAERITLLEKVRSAYELELDKADELILPYPGLSLKRKFLEIFSEPVIHDVPEAAMTKEKPSIKLSKIRDDKLNTVLQGDDKAGKTVALEKLYLDYLGGFVTHQILPILVDMKAHQAGSTEVSLEQLIARKYEINRSRVKTLCQQYTVCILIDNCDASFPQLKKMLENFSQISKRWFFIGTSSELLTNMISLDLLNVEIPVQLHLHELGNSQVRNIAVKLVPAKGDQIDQLLVRSRSLFNQLNIPVNYWNCSLFFTVADTDANINLRSQFDLIQLYVEKILERSRFASDSNPGITFETFKSYLGSLAHFLREKNEEFPSATWAEIVEFTEGYRKANLKFSISTEQFMKLLTTLNVFRQIDDTRLTFRVNGIFDYSFAVFLYANEKFRNELFESSFLNYPNQWEYYSGLAKHDTEFLKSVALRAARIFEPLVKQYIDNIPEDSLLLKIPGSFREELSLVLHADVESDSVVPLKPEEKDEIDDEMRSDIPSEDRKRAQIAATMPLENETDLNAVERAFRIVSRVFRNTDFNESEEVFRIFDNILTWGMLFGAAIEDEFKDAPTGSIPLPGSGEEQEFNKELIRQYMPLVVEGLIFHHVAQANMLRIFDMARAKYAQNMSQKQYKHFLVTLLVIELNPPEHVNMIKELIKETSNSALRHILYYKLFTLLITKGHDNKTFAVTLRQLIIDLGAKLWPNGREIAQKQLQAQERMAQIKPD